MAGLGNSESVAQGSIGPDVTVSDLPQTQKWGEARGITAYSIATNACNVGDEVLPWIDSTNQHPVIAQNLYRLKEGRLEQVGMSWLKHGFGALALDECGGNCVDPGTLTVLGVGCSDPYTTGLNGDQDGFPGIAGLGPRSEVNASTGEFPFPYGSQGQAGDVIYKRLQVHNEDLDPALNPEALYFIEGHYITPDDAAAGNGSNNVSHRQVTVSASFELIPTGETSSQRPAILAWGDTDPEVVTAHVDIPGDGRMTLAARATQVGNLWHYEYALHNTNSHRSAQSLSIPGDAEIAVSGAGFHSVDYHSGEPYAATPWAFEGGEVNRWGTDTFAEDPNANALRWGTLYNFWFDSDRPPTSTFATIGLFRPGSPDNVLVTTLGPATTGIFEDGFETGDTSRWSTVSP